MSSGGGLFGEEVDGGVLERSVVGSNCDTVPLFLRAVVVDVGEGGAVVERISSNTRNAVGDGYACHTCTVGKRITSDALANTSFFKIHIYDFGCGIRTINSGASYYTNFDEEILTTVDLDARQIYFVYQMLDSFSVVVSRS